MKHRRLNRFQKLFRKMPSVTFKDGLYFYPWEKSFTRLVTPFEEFIHRQTTGGVILMLGAVVALVLANSPFREAYEHLVHLPIRLGAGGWAMEKSLAHWVNEGLMALFFLVVGLEIKREILVGELADLKKAALPMFGALGGMVVPALLYRLLNPNPALVQGWGIPMATDIAFCVAVLVLLGRRVPESLMIFLVALAIVDDLGAVLVIALFYTGQIMVGPIMVAAGFLLALILLNMGGVRSLVPYGLTGTAMWFALLSSGIHATVAGILVAFCIPANPSYHPKVFSFNVRQLMEHFDNLTSSRASVLDNSDQFAVLQSLRRGIQKAESPLRRIEVVLHLPVALIVIPLFAITNAGVHLSYQFLSLVAAHPVAHGIFAGLVLGKFLGITGFSWVAVRLRLASLPANVGIAHVAGVGFLGGIGFTMSIFIAELCFGNFPERVVVAKTAIILASGAAGMLGITWLLLVGRWGAREEAVESGGS